MTIRVLIQIVVTKQNSLKHVIILPLKKYSNGRSEIACRLLKPKCYSSLTNLPHKTKNFNYSPARLIINLTVRPQILLSEPPGIQSVTNLSSIKSKRAALLSAKPVKITQKSKK
jgi:hypothetical protein